MLHTSTMAILPLALAATLLSSLSLAAVEPPQEEHAWPQWNGPDGSGVSKETAWSVEGKKESLWSAEVGLGYSTVVVQDGVLVTMGYNRSEGLDIVWCFDAISGEELWAHAYPSEIWNRAHEGGTVNTPSFDGDVLYSLNREGNLYCLDVATGEVVWHTFLKSEDDPYELKIPSWGFSASPLVLEDELLLNCGRVLALDKESGDVLWISKDYGDGYGTPIAFEHVGEPVLAVLNGNGVAVLSREDGSELFFHEFGGQSRGINSATPVLVDAGLFISSGPRSTGALLSFGKDKLEEVWSNREMVTSFSGCVSMGDHLYGYDRQILKCLDLKGNTAWQVRGLGNGAVSGAGDKIIATAASGELIVAEASAKEYKELSRVKLFEEGSHWTKPILVNGIIYCRNSKGRLLARDHRLAQKD